jgi:putative membrane protein
MFSAVVAAVAIGTAGPAIAQAGAGAGQSGASGAGSGQSNPAGGQAGTSGAGGASSIAGGGQSGSDTVMPTAAAQPKVDDRQQFIEKAAIANMAEIQLGQLAASNAQNPQVKQFAQMMVDEHTKALDELRTAAGSTSLPSALDKKHQKLHDKLSKLQGAAFDRAYMDAMVDAHKDTEKLLSKRVGHGGMARGESASHGTTAMAGTAGTSGATGTSGSGTPSQAGDASGTSSGATTPAGAASGSSVSGATTGTSGSASGGVDEWAASTLPKVQSHLAQARTIDDQVKQQPRAGSPGAPGGNSGTQQTPSGATPPQR